MAKFIKVCNGSYVNVDQITSIMFDPHSFGLVLSIHTSDDKISWAYSNTENDRKAMRQIVNDIRAWYEGPDQLPSFWEMICDLDVWLKTQEEQNG